MQTPSKDSSGSVEVAWDGLAGACFAEQDRDGIHRDGDWWCTGDVGYRTRFGCLHMLDREVDMIAAVRGSLEMEDIVPARRRPGLTELVVVPGPDAEPVPVICTVEDKPLDPARWRGVAAFPQLAGPVQLPQAELPRTAPLKAWRRAWPSGSDHIPATRT
ncbi:hypothetical protein AB0N81_12285 [Streptomyces sp. NPDC093510]|uniref:hypothetical protein n=1 Tax=Streptomyces sp. NPDC093510 TaxID=3155199 RepID=UPI003430203F